MELRLFIPILALFASGLPALARGDGVSSAQLQQFLKSYQQLQGSDWLNDGQRGQLYSQAFAPSGACGMLKSSDASGPDATSARKACLKLKNFDVVVKQMSACGLDLSNSDVAAAAKKIAWGLAASDAGGISDCVNLKDALQAQVKQIQDVTNVIQYNDAVLDTVHFAAQNAVKAYYVVTKTYPGADDPDIVGSICRRPTGSAPSTSPQSYDHAICGQFEPLMRTELDSLAQQPIQRLSYDQIFANLASRLAGLNGTLSKIHVKANCDRTEPRSGLCTDYAPDWGDPSDTHYPNYDAYVRQYNEAIASPGGMLLGTSVMRAKVGSFRTLSDLSSPTPTAQLGDSTPQFTFAASSMYSHDELRPADQPCGRAGACGAPMSDSDRAKLVSSAVDELKDRLKQEMLALSSIQTTSRDLNNSKNSWDHSFASANPLERLIRTSPLAVGQMLLEHPERALLVCQGIKDIPKIKETEARWKTVWVSGGLIAGGAAAATSFLSAGASAPVTVPMSTALITASVSALGAGIGFAATGSELYYATQNKSVAEGAETGYLAGQNQDPASLRQADQARAAFNKALAMAVANGVLAQPLTREGLLQVAARLKATETGTQLAGDLGALERTVREFGTQSSERMAQFFSELGADSGPVMQKLSKIPEAMARLLAQRLRAGTLNAEELEGALKACASEFTWVEGSSPLERWALELVPLRRALAAPAGYVCFPKTLNLRPQDAFSDSLNKRVVIKSGNKSIEYAVRQIKPDGTVLLSNQAEMTILIKPDWNFSDIDGDLHRTVIGSWDGKDVTITTQDGKTIFSNLPKPVAPVGAGAPVAQADRAASPAARSQTSSPGSPATQGQPNRPTSPPAQGHAAAPPNPAPAADTPAAGASKLNFFKTDTPESRLLDQALTNRLDGAQKGQELLLRYKNSDSTLSYTVRRNGNEVLVERHVQRGVGMERTDHFDLSQASDREKFLTRVDLWERKATTGAQAQATWTYDRSQAAFTVPGTGKVPVDQIRASVNGSTYRVHVLDGGGFAYYSEANPSRVYRLPPDAQLSYEQKVNP